MARNNKRKGAMTVAEAGRKGGLVTKEAYGPEFYSRIGKKGGQHSHRGSKKNQNK